ncbi:MFS general substrate transporter [Aaosphaeria arxii CBS 175.79]|uniref:MFS general substrate transporter n=1 Tax=Aaosphaeria arxii CBS 175.79 TaxID=1450172 RepID=A0A6A5Y3R4_9PLEO|nr:MFS general substrate transporter [Aaosphaeria arxii CBS 175.79]KAF2020118.1 MFS general substrate transporter [Aaosphaeria arxii CBS 175.79]
MKLGVPEPPRDQNGQPVNVNDWDGPQDPGNPLNWSLLSRIYHVTCPALFGFAVTFGTSVYSPAVFDIMKDFDVSRTAALTGLTVYTLGLGFGPVLSAPISELHGRKIVYLISSPICMLFTLGAGFSKSFASFIVCRFFAGLTGSPALAVGAGSSVDVVAPQHRAVASSFFIMAPFFGPSIGPIVGGFVAQYKSWRWTQWCIIFITLAVYLMSLPMKETYKPIILKRRARKQGIVVPKTATNEIAVIWSILLQNLVKPMRMLLIEPVVLFFSLYTAFAFGILFLLFAAIPYTFQRPPYNFTTSQSGLVFIAVGVGVVLASVTNLFIDKYIYQKIHRRTVAEGKSHVPPEHRLYSSMIGSVGIPIGLFWFAWTADKGYHWAIPVVATIPFAWGNLCLFISTAMFSIDTYGPQHGASAIAANGIVRYTLGAVFPLFTIQMYTNLGIGWATSLLGFLSILMLPIPFVFFKWGPKIRERSFYSPLK